MSNYSKATMMSTQKHHNTSCKTPLAFKNLSLNSCLFCQCVLLNKVLTCQRLLGSNAFVFNYIISSEVPHVVLVIVLLLLLLLIIIIIIITIVITSTTATAISIVGPSGPASGAHLAAPEPFPTLSMLQLVLCPSKRCRHRNANTMLQAFSMISVSCAGNMLSRLRNRLGSAFGGPALLWSAPCSIEWKPLFSSMLPRILIDFSPYRTRRTEAGSNRDANLQFGLAALVRKDCLSVSIYTLPWLRCWEWSGSPLQANQPNMAEREETWPSILLFRTSSQVASSLEPLPAQGVSHKVKWIFRLLNIIEELVKLVKLATSWLKNVQVLCCCSTF